MNTTDILKLFPSLDKSTLTAAEHEYAREVAGIATRGLETMIFGIVHTFQRTWQADDDVTVLQKLKSLGVSAAPLLELHSGVAQVLNSLASAINAALPPGEHITPYDLTIPGVIIWNADGSVADYTPAPPEPEPEPQP